MWARLGREGRVASQPGGTWAFFWARSGSCSRKQRRLASSLGMGVRVSVARLAVGAQA